MKSLLSPLVILCATLSLSGCFWESTPTEPTIEISAAMQSFMDSFDGTSIAVQRALVVYLKDQSKIFDPIGNYDLKFPQVTAQQGSCYTMDAQTEYVIRVYEICREGELINDISFVRQTPLPPKDKQRWFYNR